jgi:ribulose-phosphate 3-epimerase
MAEIVPTILAESPEIYASRLDLVTRTARRVHVDIVDGKFATTKTIGLAQVYVPDGVLLDLHLMVENPDDYISSALALKPNLIIVHAEAHGDHVQCAANIQAFGVKAGLAYLKDTNPDERITAFDHALVFTGNLGHYGGQLYQPSLAKVLEIKELNPAIEVGVDGGINRRNMQSVIDASADVLNAGMGYEGMIN